MKNILFLVGSLRQHSLNARLARVGAANLPDGYRATFFDLGDIPLFNTDLEGDDCPQSVKTFRAAVRGADGVFWTTPEYNYALPGVVKNAIDWASRPMLPRHSFVGTPMNAAVATVSATNGIRALSDLKRIWSNCGGVSVSTFDFVLQQAPTKFLDEHGAETLEPASLATLRFSIDNLIRAVEADAGAVVTANWDAFVGQLA
jgi:chromate reductase